MIADLDADAVSGWLAQQRAAGMSRETSNHYVGSAKGFTRWLVQAGRAITDPLVRLTKLNADTDRRKVRRVLTDTEFTALLDAAQHSRRRLGGLDGQPGECCTSRQRGLVCEPERWPA